MIFQEKITFQKYCLRKNSKPHFWILRNFRNIFEFGEFLAGIFGIFRKIPQNSKMLFGFFSETKFLKFYFFLKKHFIWLFCIILQQGLILGGLYRSRKGSASRPKKRNFWISLKTRSRYLQIPLNSLQNSLKIWKFWFFDRASAAFRGG